MCEGAHSFIKGEITVEVNVIVGNGDVRGRDRLNNNGVDRNRSVEVGNRKGYRLRGRRRGRAR